MYRTLFLVCSRSSFGLHREIHRLVLVDTPISTYFNDCLRNENIDETNIEFIRNSVYKVSAYACTLTIGGETLTRFY